MPGVKIVFFAKRFYPDIGGVERHTFEVANQLVKRGNEVVIVSEGHDGREKQEEIQGIKSYKIPVTVQGKLKKFQIWKCLLKNASLIKDADVIHCHDVFFWYLPFVFIFPKKRVFTTFHGWEEIYPIPKRNIILRKIWEKLSKGNICVGEFIEKWYGTKPTVITYGGVGVSEKEPNVPLKSNKRVIFYARLEKSLGLDEYLKAINILREKKMELTFSFVGEGSMGEEVEKFGKKLGLVKDLVPYISKSRFIFATSNLTVLEALSRKRLVFVYLINELKKDTFMMSPFWDRVIICKDYKDIADKVIYFLRNPEEERKILDNNYQWVKTQTWKRVADQYLNLWDKDEASRDKDST